MAVANHEGSILSFPGASGWFTHTLGGGSLIGGGSVLNYGVPMWNDANVYSSPAVNPPSGLIIAQAIQTVDIVEHTVTAPVLVIGHTGHAGYEDKAGTVDVKIDAIVTSGFPLGKSLLSYEQKLSEGQNSDQLFDLKTTDGQDTGFGREATVSGLFLNNLTFTFTQNSHITVSMGLVGDGVTWFPISAVPQGMDSSIQHIPATWEEVTLSGVSNGLVVLSGVQNCTVSASMTRDLIYQIGTFLPIDKPSKRPHVVNVTLNSLANSVALNNWLNRFSTTFDANNTANLIVFKVSAQGPVGQGDKGRGAIDWIVASGLRPGNATLRAGVGANSMIDLTFEGSNLRF